MEPAEPTIGAQDGETFVRLYAKAQPRILAFVQTMIPMQQDAEEVLQETSIILWNKWPQFDRDKNFAAWACGIARYEVLRYFRKRPKVLHLSEQVLGQIADLAMEQIESESQQADSLHALRDCIGELPERDSSLLAMRYRRGIPVTEIATEVGLARSTVFEALQKTRDRLLRCVQRRLKTLEGAW